MIIYFTWEDRGNKNRVKYLRGALWRNGHRIIKRAPESLPEGSVWMAGLSHKNRDPLSPQTLALMKKAPGRVFFFQTNDENDFNVERIVDRQVHENALFLRNHWPSDPERIPAEIRDRTGFLNPLIAPFGAKPGRRLADRTIPILFYGVNTGRDNYEPGRTVREEALRRIKSARLPFVGGLVAHPEYRTPDYLRVDKISPKAHGKLMSDTRICLALWGNCPLTYRLFEGLSRRCLVAVPSLSAIQFVHCGLTPGRHYVEVKPDLSDLVGKLEDYLGNPVEAQQIADAGHRHFCENFRFSGVNLPQPLYADIVRSWRGRFAEANPGRLRRTVSAAVLSAVKNV
jgi:hypothetical protein